MAFKYGTLMSGGICPCGAKLSYSSWETITEKKERCYCRSCGRSEYASELKSTDSEQLRIASMDFGESVMKTKEPTTAIPEQHKSP